MTTLTVENKDNTLPYYWDVILYQFAAGVTAQGGFGTPSTDGTNKKAIAPARIKSRRFSQ